MNARAENPVVVATVEQLREVVREVIVEELGALAGKPPALLDRRGLAQALGCCVDVVDRLRREGAPELTVGEAPRFELEGVLEWLRTRSKP